jgi:hypothetical protein
MTTGATAVLLVIGGGAAGVAAWTGDEDQPREVRAAARQEVPVAALPETPAVSKVEPPALAAGLGDAVHTDGRRTSDEADRTATRTPRAQGTEPPKTTVPAPVPAAVTTTRTVTETRGIPFRTRLVRDPSLQRGEHQVQTEGVAGSETLRYLVTYVGGRETERRFLDSTVTKEPQHQVIAVGGRGWRHDRRRECGPSLRPCLLGRGHCPDGDKITESGSIAALDGSLPMLDPADLKALRLEPGLVC